jgi:RNA polymerase-binding transcription factor
MSDPTDQELSDRYRAALIDERSALMAASVQTEEGRKPVVLDQTMVGRLSRMDAMQGQAMAAAVEARRHGRMRAIDAGLARLSEGEFGWCADCGGFIGFGRLDSDATAMRCISCAS